MNTTPAASLRVLDGPDAGTVVALEDGRPLRVGSSMAGDVAIAGLAPVHAEFVWRGGTLSLAAAAPVTVNGAPVRRAELQDGDEVWLAGQMVFGVSLPDALAAVAVEPPPIPVAAAEAGWQIESSPFGPAGASPAGLASPDLVDGLDFAPSQVSFAAPSVPAPPPVPAALAAEAPPATVGAPAAPPLVSFAEEAGSRPPSNEPPKAPRPRPAPVPSRPVAARPLPRPRAPGSGKRVLGAIAAGAALLAALGGGGYAYWATRPPQVVALQPASGFAGDEVVIEGGHFASGATKVSFGATPAVVVAAQRERLRVKVPAVPVKARTRVEVTVETEHGRSSSPFDLRSRPRWESLTPPVALPGDSITLVGAGFDAGALQVSIGGQPATIEESGPERLVVRLPPLQAQMTTRDPVSVAVRVDGQEVPPRREIRLGSLPYVAEVTPRKVVPGAEFAVHGFGFDPAPGGTHAFVGGQPALVLSATETSLTLTVPAFARSLPDAAVEVVARGGRSVGGPGVEVERITSGSYVLRFLAAVVPDRPELADVASEFAPVLRLASPGDAPDVRRRARKLATALNEMVAGAITGQPVALEVREHADGIWLAQAGGPPLTRVDQQDADAYAPGLSPRVLAEHWAALLDDHLVLFVRHDRPTRMTTRSPLGRAMTELQVALLRGRGADVPPDAPERVPAALAARLGRMALEVPRSAPVSASAFEGDWQGELRDEALGGPQSISLSLRPEAPGLRGTLRLQSAAGSMEQPAQALLVQGERLSFKVGLRGAQRLFVATRTGSTLSGTVRSPDGTRDEGHFELRLQIR